MAVPYLTWCNVRVQEAVGTAAACGLPIAVTSAITYMWRGWDVPGLPEWSTGFVYWPAFLGIVLTSVWFARLGAALAHRLPSRVLKRIFSVLLFVVGYRFLFG